MKVLVCGSRTYTNQDPVREELAKLPADAVIIHGAARGADSLAANIARDLGLQVEGYPADWDKYGKSAGYRRNIEMLSQKPDLVIAFWDGVSPGTAHTIQEARKRGIPVNVIM